MTWHPGDDGEMQQKYKHVLELVHDEWEPKGLPPTAQFYANNHAGAEVATEDIDPGARKEMKT